MFRAAPASCPFAVSCCRTSSATLTPIDRTFLDRAGSAGGFAVLASRSASAIEHALGDVAGGEGMFSHVWSAAGTKVVFRSTDARTQQLVRGLARVPSRTAPPTRGAATVRARAGRVLSGRPRRSVRAPTARPLDPSRAGAGGTGRLLPRTQLPAPSGPRFRGTAAVIHVPETGRKLGRCLCGIPLIEGSYRDQGSLAEARLSRLCQSCIDQVFLVPPRESCEPRHRLRFGVIAAHNPSGRDAGELALLPFLCIPARDVVAWEARHALRIGTVLASGSPSELDPMACILAGHRIRVTEVRWLADPRLDEWFSDLDLMIGLDAPALKEIVAACPSLGHAHAVSLADAVPWRHLSPPHLLPFDAFVRAHSLDPRRSDPCPPPSPLRTCALIGAALHLNEGAPRRHLLLSVKDRLANPYNPKRDPQ